MLSTLRRFFAAALFVFGANAAIAPAQAADDPVGDVFQLAQACPSGMVACPRGAWGTGGCYRPGYASCTNGQVCSSGMQACGPGAWGRGGCYRPAYASCNNGMICSSGMQACAPGSQGRGGCYAPAYRRCVNGRIM